VKAKVALRGTFGRSPRYFRRSVGAPMKHSVIIPLSRQEEDTLRLIAHGISSTRHLSPDDLDQLAKLRLVDRLDGKVTLSELGQVRLAQSQEEQFLAIIRAARDHQPGLRVS
jgi:RNase P/RNase MRP subunit POP5